MKDLKDWEFPVKEAKTINANDDVYHQDILLAA